MTAIAPLPNPFTALEEFYMFNLHIGDCLGTDSNRFLWGFYNRHKLGNTVVDETAPEYPIDHPNKRVLTENQQLDCLQRVDELRQAYEVMEPFEISPLPYEDSDLVASSEVCLMEVDDDT